MASTSIVATETSFASLTLRAPVHLAGPKEHGERVFAALEQPYRIAKVFREHLEAAGVKHAELCERSEARRPIRVHDLRATMITLNLANGRTEAWTADRTGHTTSA